MFRALSRTVAVICILFLTACTNFFFYPHKELYLLPDQIGIKYEVVNLEDQNEPDLEGWFLPADPEVEKGQVVFFHGNAENISTHLRSVHWLPARGYSVLMAEYRGYGNSDGQAEIAGVHRDANRFLKYAIARSSTKKIPLILYGQSLGASIALYLAGTSEFKKDIDLLIAEGGFVSYPKMARDSLSGLSLFRYFFYPFSVFVSNQYSPDKALKNIKAPLIVLHGEQDKTVPVENALLIKEKKVNAKVFLISDRGHLNVITNEADREMLVAMIEKSLKK